MLSQTDTHTEFVLFSAAANDRMHSRLWDVRPANLEKNTFSPLPTKRTHFTLSLARAKFPVQLDSCLIFYFSAFAVVRVYSRLRSIAILHNGQARSEEKFQIPKNRFPSVKTGTD
jgi:hypothetical protein